MNLKQKLIKEAMQEAGQKIAVIDANAGLIAECEALAAQLCATGLDNCSALVTIHGTSVTARVFVCFRRRSAVLQAIENAGLTLTGQSTLSHQSADEPHYALHLAGLDTPVEIHSPAAEAAELAEAA